MWVKMPSQIDREVYYIGNFGRNAFLVNGSDGLVLIEAGILCDYEDFEQGSIGFSFSLKDVRYVILLHSHFDHIGILPILKRHNPDIKVIGHSYIGHIFSKEKNIEVLRKAEESFCKELPNEEYDFSLLSLDYEINSELVSELLGKPVEVIFTKGHSNCSVSLYFKDSGGLYTSDSAGIPLINWDVVHFGTKNFYDYKRSFDLLQEKEVGYWAPGHGGVLFDRALKVLWKKAEESLERLENKIVQFIDKGYEITDIVNEILPWYMVEPISLLGRLPSEDAILRMAKRIAEEVG